MGFAAPLARHRLKLSTPAVSLLSWQAPVSLALAVPRSRLRDAGIYALQMWAYTAHYKMPNDDHENLLRRLRVDYPIGADRVVGLGEVPAVRLQRALGRPGEVPPHDLILTWAHWGWFIVPHASLAYLLWRRPAHYPRAACLMAAVFDIGLMVHSAVPTAPPWWAGGRGGLPPVRRIMVDVGERFWGRAWQPLYSLFSGNPFSAMPSLHFATSVMAAHVLADAGGAEGLIGWSYALTLGFALVYLGEHYVVDLAAGLALTEGVRRLEPHAAPAVAAVGRAIARLEPEAS